MFFCSFVNSDTCTDSIFSGNSLSTSSFTRLKINGLVKREIFSASNFLKSFKLGINPGKITWKIAHNSSILFSRSEEHTSELQSRFDLVCRLLLEKKKQYI